jgi:hypothetical protein
MAVKPETVAAVRKLVPLADKVEKASKQLSGELDELKRKLAESVKARQRSMIELHLKTLEGVINRSTAGLADCDQANDHLDRIDEDEDFLADKTRREQVEKAGKKVADAKDLLTKVFGEGKRLQNAGEKGRSEAIGTDDDVMRELAQHDRWIKQHRKEMRALLDKTEALNNKASEAAERRDAKGLAAAQAEMKKLDIGVAEIVHKGHHDSLDRLQKKADSGKLGPELAADLKDGIKDLRAEMAGAAVPVEYMRKNHDRVMNELRVEEIDVKKALKVLNLDAKFESKLKKALEGPATARVKALDAISKEAGSAMDGKAMLAALVKQKVLSA